MISTDLKQKTSALRKRHVLDAAIRVFKRDGYRGATIRSIAREAGVSDGTIYNVFENKEALLLGALNSLLVDVREPNSLPDPAQAVPVQQTLGQLFLERWRGIDPEALAIIRILWSEALQDQALGARYLDVIMKPAINGFPDLRPDAALTDSAHTQMLPHVTTAMFLGLVLLKLLGDPLLERSGDEVATLAAEILGRGLETPSTND